MFYYQLFTKPTKHPLNCAQLYLYIAVRNTHLSIKIRDTTQTAKWNKTLLPSLNSLINKYKYINIAEE